MLFRSEGSLIGAGCLIFDSDMHGLPLGSDCPVKAAAIHIGERVFVGANCTILKGVRIGDGAVIGAHSLVARDIPPHTWVAGNPATAMHRRSGVMTTDHAETADNEEQARAGRLIP